MPDKPVFFYSIGSVAAAGFASSIEKEGKTSVWHNVVFTRSYFDAAKNAWKRSPYFSLRDLLALRRLVDAVLDRLIVLDAKPNTALRDLLGGDPSDSTAASQSGHLPPEPLPSETAIAPDEVPF